MCVTCQEELPEFSWTSHPSVSALPPTPNTRPVRQGAVVPERPLLPKRARLPLSPTPPRRGNNGEWSQRHGLARRSGVRCDELPLTSGGAIAFPPPFFLSPPLVWCLSEAWGPTNLSLFVQNRAAPGSDFGANVTSVSAELRGNRAEPPANCEFAAGDRSPRMLAAPAGATLRQNSLRCSRMMMEGSSRQGFFYLGFFCLFFAFLSAVWGSQYGRRVCHVYRPLLSSFAYRNFFSLVDLCIGLSVGRGTCHAHRTRHQDDSYDSSEPVRGWRWTCLSPRASGSARREPETARHENFVLA